MSEKMLNCVHCRKEVQKHIKKCPHCGGIAPANTHSQGLLAIGITVAIFALYCFLR